MLAAENGRRNNVGGLLSYLRGLKRQKAVNDSMKFIENCLDLIFATRANIKCNATDDDMDRIDRFISAKGEEFMKKYDSMTGKQISERIRELSSKTY